jgi:hypothetical protein
MLTVALPKPMAKESEFIPRPKYGTDVLRKPRQILPGGRTVALVLSTMVFLLIFSNIYPDQTQIFYGSPEPTQASHQTSIAGMILAQLLSS